MNVTNGAVVGGLDDAYLGPEVERQLAIEAQDKFASGIDLELIETHRTRLCHFESQSCPLVGIDRAAQVPQRCGCLACWVVMNGRSHWPSW